MDESEPESWATFAAFSHSLLQGLHESNSRIRALLMPRSDRGRVHSKRVFGSSVMKIPIAAPLYGILVLSLVYSLPAGNVATSLARARHRMPSTQKIQAKSHDIHRFSNVHSDCKHDDRRSMEFPPRRVLRLRGAGFSEEDAELDKAMKLLEKAEQAYKAVGVGKAKVISFSYFFVVVCVGWYWCWRFDLHDL